MRIIAVFLISLFCASVQAVDFKVVDLPTEANINKIQFDTDVIGWAVTSDGEVLSTYNGGETWKAKKVNPRAINDIHMKGKVGFICGEKGLLMKTTNRGGSWEDLSLSFKLDLIGVVMATDSIIVVCGNDQNSISKTKGVVYRSTDRGKTWEKQAHLGNGYQDIEYFPPTKVYLLAIKKVFHSISSGWHFWEGKYTGDRMAFGFDFMDDWGYMAGIKGYFAKSIDHGRTWTEVELDTDKNLFDVAMFDKSSGLAVGEGGILVFFGDFGDSFSIINSGVDKDLTTVCITDRRIYCGGENGTILISERE